MSHTLFPVSPSTLVLPILVYGRRQVPLPSLFPVSPSTLVLPILVYGRRQVPLPFPGCDVTTVPDLGAEIADPAPLCEQGWECSPGGCNMCNGQRFTLGAQIRGDLPIDQLPLPGLQ